MGEVLFPQHSRKLWELCRQGGIRRPPTLESVKVSFARFTDDRTGQLATVRLSEESLSLLLFFQEKVPKEKRFNPSAASYIGITAEMRAELLAFMADVRDMSREARNQWFPEVVETATRAELFWKE